MKKHHYILLVLLTLTLSGCSLFQFGGTTEKGHNIPLKPKHVQPDMQNGKQQAADIIVQLAEEADKIGISANTQQSKTLLEMSLLMQMLEGVPVERIDWEDSDKVAELIEDVKELEADYRAKVFEWEEVLRELAENKDAMIELHKENSWLSRTIGWMSGIGVFLIILCCAFPGIGIPLAFRIIKNVRTAGEETLKGAKDLASDQVGQIVQAIEESKPILKKEAPAAYGQLMGLLRQHTDAQTRDLINEVKVKKGKQ